MSAGSADGEAHRAGVRRLARVDDQAVPRDVPGLVAREVQRCVGDVDRLACDAEVRAGADALGGGLDLGGVPCVGEGSHAGHGVAGGDGVHPHAVLSQLPCDRAGESDDCGLARRVRMGAQSTDDARGARRADDDTRTLRHHDPSSVLHAEEHRTQQDGDGTIPVLDRGAADRTDRPEDARVVEHAVETAELCDGEIYRGRDRVLVGDVDLDEPRRIAELGRQPLPRVDLDVGHDHARALLGEAPYRAGADAAGAARDDRHLAFDPTAHRALRLLVSRHAVLGTRNTPERSGGPW